MRGFKFGNEKKKIFVVFVIFFDDLFYEQLKEG